MQSRPSQSTASPVRNRPAPLLLHTPPHLRTPCPRRLADLRELTHEDLDVFGFDEATADEIWLELEKLPPPPPPAALGEMPALSAPPEPVVLRETGDTRGDLLSSINQGGFHLKKVEAAPQKKASLPAQGEGGMAEMLAAAMAERRGATGDSDDDDDDDWD